MTRNREVGQGRPILQGLRAFVVRGLEILHAERHGYPTAVGLERDGGIVLTTARPKRTPRIASKGDIHDGVVRRVNLKRELRPGRPPPNGVLDLARGRYPERGVAPVKAIPIPPTVLTVINHGLGLRGPAHAGPDELRTGQVHGA